ncbi:putative exported protein [Nonlabens dokdonensis DSW-6]|nr:putative exported protein [Nonlabens dokdonensis DSW-6]
MSQQEWLPVTNFPGSPRAWAATFTIGDRIYIGTGGVNLSFEDDLWEYNTITNTWSQKANFTGLDRTGAVGFSVNGIGYLGLGTCGFQQQCQDIKSYNPQNNQWTSVVNNFPATGVANVSAFTIDNKAYLLTNGSFAGVGNDSSELWEYTPATNSLIQKTSLPGLPRNRASSFTLNSKGYIAVGFHYDGQANANLKDLWEYNPITDVWIQRADYPGLGSTDCIAFSMNGHAYLGLGYLANTDLWRYDPTMDAWTIMPSFWGAGRIASVSATVGNTGYMGLGYTTNNTGTVNFNDFWRFQDATLSNESIDKNYQINTYPNPFTDKIFIELPTFIETDVKLDFIIYDIKGQIVRKGKLYNATIDLKSLSSGVFILKCFSRSHDYQNVIVKK